MHLHLIHSICGKIGGFLFRCKHYFHSGQLLKLYTGFIRPCLEYCSHIWGSSPYISLLGRVESKAIRLIGDPSLTSTLDPLSLRRKVASPSLFYRTTLVTALKNWLPVFHLQWLGHVPHGRHHLPTTIVWNSPMQELIGSVMVSSLLLPAFGTLSLLLYFWLPSTSLSSKSKSITTLGTRWHDLFFITRFRYFIFLYYSFNCHSFPFPKGCRLEKGHIVPVLCSHSYNKKKKKKKKVFKVDSHQSDTNKPEGRF